MTSQAPRKTRFPASPGLAPAVLALTVFAGCAGLAVLAGCATQGPAKAGAASSRSTDPRVVEQVDRFRRAVVKKNGSRLGKGGDQSIATFERALRTIAFSSVEPVPPALLGDAAVRSLDSEAAAEATTPDEMVDIAIAAMMKAGDPDGSYERKPAVPAADAAPAAPPGGVGLEVKIRDGALTVVAPVPGAPAAKAGIATGDRIVAVNGEGTAGLPLMAAVERLRGDVGSMVTLTVERSGDDTRQVTLERVVVQLHTVSIVASTERCAAIRIAQFTEGTSAEIEQYLAGEADDLGLVLDLRGNGGGLMSSVVASADLFLASGRIAKVSARGAAAPTVYTAQAGGPATRLPLVVLVDGETAAGAEIFAAALRDNGRARVLGARTAGHGTIQTTVPLANDGVLKLTTSRVSTAGGQPVSAGLIPEPGSDALVASASGDPLMDKAFDVLGCSDEEPQAVAPQQSVAVEDEAAAEVEPAPRPQARPEPEIGYMPHRKPAPKPAPKPAKESVKESAKEPAKEPTRKAPSRPHSKPPSKPVDDSDNSPADI